MIPAKWKPALAVGASGETLIKGTHNKSINKTVVWGYSDRNETWSTLSKEKDKSLYRKAEYKIGSSK